MAAAVETKAPYARRSSSIDFRQIHLLFAGGATGKGQKLKAEGGLNKWPSCSSSLSDHLFFSFGLGPRCWRELSDLGNLGGWQARE